MASRLTTFSPLQMQVPQLQVPMELLYAKLQAAQGSKDEFDQLSTLMPQYLQEHSTDASKYKQLVGKVSEDVANAFASGDSGPGMRLLQQGKDFIRKQNQAGGLGYALQSAYDSDAAAKKAMEELHADAVKKGNNINYQLAKSTYKVPELGYDPQTGNFNKPSASNVPTFFDVDNELREWIKTINPQEYGFSRVEGDYVYTTEGKKYHIREFAPQFLKDPRIRQQLEINAQHSFLNMSPEARLDIANTANQAIAGNKSQLQSEFNTLQTMLDSKDKKKVKEAQAKLASLGYMVGDKEYGASDIDGNSGERTKAAMEQLKSTVESVGSKSYGEQDVLNLLFQEQLTGVSAKALAARPDSESTKITGENWRARELFKSALRKDEQKDYLNQMAAMSTSTAVPVPNYALDINTVDKLIKTTDEAVVATTASMQEQMNASPELVTTFGTPERAMEFRKALDDNGGNMKAAASQMGVTVGEMETANKVFSKIENRGFAASAADLSESTKAKGQIDLQREELGEKYIERKGTGEAEAYVKKNKLDYYGITPEMIIKNPEEATKLLEKNFREKEPMVKVASAWDVNARRANEASGAVLRELKLKISRFQESNNVKMKADFDANTDAYASTVSQGLRDDSEQFKMMDNSILAYLSLPDENNSFDWIDTATNKTTKNSKVSNVHLEDVASAVGKKGQVFVVSGDMKDGDKTTKVVRRVYVGNNAEAAQWTQNWAMNAATEALNNKDYTTALRAVEIGLGTNDLNRSLKPSKSRSTTFIEKVGDHTQSSNQNFTVIKEYGKPNNSTSLVVIGNPEFPQYAVAQNKGTHMEIFPSLTDENTPGVYSSFDKAARVFKLLEATDQGLIGQRTAKIRPENVNPTFPLNSSEQ